MFVIGFEEKFIPAWYIPLIFAVIFYSIYYATGYFLSEYRKRGTSNLIMWLNALSIPYTLSSLMYNGWAKDSWLQPITTFRITLILTGVITTYLVIVYIRATISYKKKRGNQRIFEEPRKEHKKRWKKRTEAGRKDKEITIMLGRSTESEDRTPPV